MSYAKINVLLALVLFIAVFFSLPANNYWLYAKVLSSNPFTEMRQMGEEKRNLKRFGSTYATYQEIRHTLEPYKNVLLLLPANSYVRAHHIPNLTIPEPAVFYYFTGVRAVTAGSPAARQANWIMTAGAEGKMVLTEMSKVTNPDSTMEEYKKYGEP